MGPKHIISGPTIILIHLSSSHQQSTNNPPSVSANILAANLGTQQPIT
jgi:hypothetical protein